MSIDDGRIIKLPAVTGRLVDVLRIGKLEVFGLHRTDLKDIRMKEGTSRTEMALVHIPSKTLMTRGYAPMSAWKALVQRLERIRPFAWRHAEPPPSRLLSEHQWKSVLIELRAFRDRKERMFLD